MQLENNYSKKYQKTKGLVYSCQYHIVFCPKYRRSVLINGIEIRMKELLKEKQEEYGYSIIDSEVMPDHIHLLLDINPKIGIYSILSKIKSYTSHTLRKEFPALKTKLPCLWTNNSFISTCGSVNLEIIKNYISEQKNA